MIEKINSQSNIQSMLQTLKAFQAQAAGGIDEAGGKVGGTGNAQGAPGFSDMIRQTVDKVNELQVNSKNIAESYERIHRSNLIGMGVLPLQFPAGQTADSLGLTGTETFDVVGITELNNGKIPGTVSVTATSEDGSKVSFQAVVRIDTPGEADYFRHGGILQYVLRSLVKA